MKPQSVKKPKQKLRGYLNLLDTLINTIPNPIYFKDEFGIYRGCNKAFAKRIMGISRAEIIGRRSQDLTDQIPSELAALYQLNERKMLLKGGVQSFEAEVPAVAASEGNSYSTLQRLKTVTVRAWAASVSCWI